MTKKGQGQAENEVAMGNNRCMNCMKIIEGQVDVCPHCGYRPKAEEVPFGIRPGTILRGRYLVGRVLGQGGFGLTYVGYDLTLEIKTAIKEYFPSGLATRNSTVSNQVHRNTTQLDQQSWQAGCESFLKEARRMAKIDSLPGIVRVRDTFPENQTAYIVMDFIEGETLKQKLSKTGPMKYSECVRLLRPLMESLGRVHKQGLIHRDISPDNIMVQPDGSVCLLDFGAAKDITFQNAASQQVAKKGFSPPEQYREKGSIGSWTDVYALCATIYYCITGKLVPDAMDRMYEDTLDFEALPSGFPGELADALQEGLRLRPEERTQTVEELLRKVNGAKMAGVRFSGQPEAVQAQYSGQPVSAREDGQSGKRRKKPVLIVSAAAAGLLALVIVVRALTGIQKEEAFSPTPPPAPEPVASKTDQSKDANDVPSVDAQDAFREESAEGTEEVKRDTEPVGDTEGEAAEQSAYVNVLMRDNSLQEGDDGLWYGMVLGSEISRDSIATVTFTDTLDGMPDTAWDVSWEQDGTVMAWTKDRSGQDGMLDLVIGARGKVRGQDCTMLFHSYHNVEAIRFANCFDTGQATTMERMFAECGKLKELDLGGIETGNAGNMLCLFYGCESLAEIDLGGFDTGNVESMGFMFSSCKTLTTLDLSGFDTSKVTDMRAMFHECENLTELHISGFDTSKVTDMRVMFQQCESLTKLDVSSLDTESVRSMQSMFSGCGSLEALDVSGFDTRQVTDMSHMFRGCTGLKRLSVNGIDTGSVTKMECMFYQCGSLETLDVSGFDTGQVTDASCMFEDCGALAMLDVSNFDTSQMTSIKHMFKGCENLTKLDVGGFDLRRVTNMDAMFADCGITAEAAGLKTE